MVAKLFKSFFRRSDEETASFPLFCMPELPLPELLHRTKRAFLARKLGQYIGIRARGVDRFFYESLATKTFKNNKKDLESYVLYLSELMLEWGENGQDIQQEIKELNETAIFTNAMLKAYDIYKDELFGRPAHSCSCQPKCNVRDIDEKKWEIYRDVMHAATQGKFLLVKEEEVGRLEQGTIICRAGIRSRSDIPKCRELAKQAFEALGVGPLALVSWLLAVSEAVTNVIKHAEWGEMSLIQDKASKELRLIVKDQGPGFPMKELPKMVLLSGYSTKKSLGQGFTLIMRIAQKVFLSTSSQGSVLVLVFYAEEGANVNGLLKDDAKNDHRRQVD